ncbi:MFS transporter [Rhizobium sp. C4]|uniref:MFS transporter n=1 Tax=Rhizobium sp. C4 TaxID=1349800 RepID=UPI001E3C69D8|nr:MFS transporter [Rhizobium sp. C4]MCD2173735.1 MFS transporter [Rhizobium sp. C4]
MSEVRPDATPEPTALMVWLAAIGSGVLVATIYYAQPLIDPISRDIGLSRQAAGLIVTAMQIGYGLGLALIVPLADRYENRMMVTTSLVVTAMALAAIAFSGNEAAFLTSAVIAGAACVGAQVLIPMIAGMASTARRGRVIGTVMAGLVTGIMLARPFSSFLASVVGWRGVFLTAAGMTLLIGLLLRALLPIRQPALKESYLKTLRSTAATVMRYGVLRRRMAYQMSLFGMFTAFWTTVPLMLADRFGYDQQEIALFALAGAGGALAAPLAGRIADRGLSRAATIAAGLGAAILLALTDYFVHAGAIVALALSAALFDACVQSNQVISQRLIYALSEEERGRINSAYISAIFVAGSITSALGPVLYAHFGWPAIAVVGFLLTLPIALAELANGPLPAKAGTTP